MADSAYLELWRDGIVRTELAAAAVNLTALRAHASATTVNGGGGGSFGTSTDGLEFAVCSVEEAVDGIVTMGADCGAVFFNPKVAFSVGAPAANRVLINADAGAVFEDLEDYKGTAFDDFTHITKRTIADVVLLKESTTTCASSSTLPPGSHFAVAADGESFIHDKRWKALENTLEAPLVESASIASCPSAPKTFQNIDSCVPAADGCASLTYTSSLITLNASTIELFYALDGYHVHYVEGLCMDDVESPCTSQTSRWVRRRGASGAALCAASEPTLDGTTLLVLRAALRDDSEALVFELGALSNAGVRDISISSGACVGESEAVGAAVLVTDSDGSVGCWQHVHEDERSVYDFSLWTTAHPGNSFALADGRPNPITAFASAGSAKLLFPDCSWHGISRWETGLKNVELLGRLGDLVDYAVLPTTVQGK